MHQHDQHTQVFEKAILDINKRLFSPGSLSIWRKFTPRRHNLDLWRKSDITRKGLNCKPPETFHISLSRGPISASYPKATSGKGILFCLWFGAQKTCSFNINPFFSWYILILTRIIGLSPFGKKTEFQYTVEMAQIFSRQLLIVLICCAPLCLSASKGKLLCLK